MKITNRHNLPEVFERFNSERPYSKGDAEYSVTTLIDSPQIARLRDKHADEIEEDVADQVMSILGTAVHEILQVGVPENALAEKRFFATINGTRISGQIDLITATPDGYIITDYKTTRAASLQFNPEGKPEWIHQLNTYSALCLLNIEEIEEMFRGVVDFDPPPVIAGVEIIAILRDWTAAQAARNPDYPQASVVRIPITMWSGSDSYAYISERIDAHRHGEETNCSAQERWAGNAEFAVYEFTQANTRRKRATKLFDNRTDAETFSMTRDGTTLIEERPQIFRRCEGNYCGVSQFCQQHRSNQ